MFDGLLAVHLFGSIVFADEYFIFGQIEYLSARMCVTKRQGYYPQSKDSYNMSFVKLVVSQVIFADENFRNDYFV